MASNESHPLRKFWIQKSGWFVRGLHETPEDGVSEGRLCIDTWNAAIAAAESCITRDGNPEVAREKIQQLTYKTE